MRKLNIYFLRDWIAPKLEGFMKRTPQSITPNRLTVISLIAAIFSMFLFWFSGIPFSRFYLFLALVFLVLSSILDALDGALAKSKKITSKRGDFLDHFLDRVIDGLLILGITLGGYINWPIGTTTIFVVLLVSHLGILPKAIDKEIERNYGGIMGRTSRLVILILATLITLVYSEKIGFEYLDLNLNFTILGWAIIIFILFGSIIATILRFRYAWRVLASR